MTDEMLTFDEFITYWAKERPDTLATQMGERRTTYGELDTATARMIGVFQDMGIKPGDRIAYLGRNSDLYFQLFFACGRCGVVIAPIGWRLAPAEVGYILEDTGAMLLVIGAGFEEAAAKACAGLENPPAVVSEDAMWARIAARDPAEFVPADSDAAVLQLYTSGTTGKPKGAVLSNANLFSLRKPQEDAGKPWSVFEAHEAILCCMPCSHIGGTGLSINSVSSGVRAIIMPEFTPDGVLDAVDDGATRLFIVPAALQMLIQHPRAKSTDFSRVKYVFYGAAPMPLDLLREALTTMPGAGFAQVYGMTETTGTVSLLPPEDHDPAGNKRMRSAGKAVPGVQISIMDSEMNEVPRGDIGEIAIRAPSNMMGYWNLPEATAATVTPDGWLCTGDAAYMDEDGYVFIQDRIKDMIISGGENVYPAEVESAVYGHPDIAEVAVIGVPDEMWGEAVKAVCVAKPGRTIDPASVIEFTRERVAGFKVPKTVDVITEMPRNPTGKILRRQLREPYWQGRDRQV
ncbi:long-chain-fatty-acid--CoA ligase [Altererythrobacter aquiaggeris]|uniref:long-chain-fatty-acid--CoA ligase n=1 Tax=Aestuarierythrobacter aquiaggeris TaxID=1898396 RepID=UPI003016B685